MIDSRDDMCDETRGSYQEEGRDGGERSLLLADARLDPHFLLLVCPSNAKAQ